MRTEDTDGPAGGAGIEASRGAQDAVYWMGGDARWRPSGDCPPLTRTTRADVCIVGGGFTGLWAAYWIKRLSPDTDVVLLERQFCGAGASGRNGGWVNGWEDALSTLLGRFGREEAMWLLDASLRSEEAIREVVREAEIDCDLAFAEGLNLAMSPAQMESLRGEVRAAEDAGRGDLFRTLSREEAQEACGSPRAVGGVATARAGSVQPALLVQGLRRAAAGAGVRIFEASPMTDVRRTLPAVVETPAGTVVADRVVLAGGPWMARVPELRRTLFVIPSHMVATSPAAAQLDAMGWLRGRPTTASSSAAAAGGWATPAASSPRTSTTRPRRWRSSATCMPSSRAPPDWPSSGVGEAPWSARSTARLGSGRLGPTATSTTARATRATVCARPS